MSPQLPSLIPDPALPGESPPVPDKQALRLLLLWCAHQILAPIPLEPGPVSVLLYQGDEQGPLIKDHGRAPVGAQFLLANPREQELLRLLLKTYLSSDELAVVLAIGHGTYQAKEIVVRAGLHAQGREATSRDRQLLSTLTDRGVLRSSMDGYSLAIPEILPWLSPGPPTASRHTAP